MEVLDVNVDARFLPPRSPQKKKKKTLVPGQPSKPSTEECKLKIGGQVSR